MPKICLDAGHFGKYNPNYNVSPAYWESVMAWTLQEALAEALEGYENVTVVRSRPRQAEDLGLTARGQSAVGCDLFLSLHSNACASPQVDRAVVIYPVSGREKALAQKLAGTVTEVMGLCDKPQILSRPNSAGNADYYGVIRGAASVGVPGLIIEHSFHTNDRAAAWLCSEDNLKKLARAEAAVIAERFGCGRRMPGLAPHHPFTDVPAAAWYAVDVQWAWENGLVEGVDKTHFCPDAPVTRAQATALLRRFAGVSA